MGKNRRIIISACVLCALAIALVTVPALADAALPDPIDVVNDGGGFLGIIAVAALALVAVFFLLNRKPAEEPAGTEPESGESDNTEPDKEPSDEEEALYQILVKSSALNVRNNPSYESRVIGTLFRKETRLVAEESDGWGRLALHNEGRLSNGNSRSFSEPPDCWINLDYCKKIC